MPGGQLDEVWLGMTSVIVLRVENISHPSHRQVKTTRHTLLQAMKTRIDDIGCTLCIYMRLPDVKRSQEQSLVYLTCILARLADTWPSRNHRFHHRSSKCRPELGDSRTRSGSQSRDSSSRRHCEKATIALRSDIQRNKMGAVLAAWCPPSIYCGEFL